MKVNITFVCLEQMGKALAEDSLARTQAPGMVERVACCLKITITFMVKHMEYSLKYFLLVEAQVIAI